MGHKLDESKLQDLLILLAANFPIRSIASRLTRVGNKQASQIRGLDLFVWVNWLVGLVWLTWYVISPRLAWICLICLYKIGVSSKRQWTHLYSYPHQISWVLLAAELPADRVIEEGAWGLSSSKNGNFGELIAIQASYVVAVVLGDRPIHWRSSRSQLQLRG